MPQSDNRIHRAHVVMSDSSTGKITVNISGKFGNSETVDVSFFGREEHPFENDWVVPNIDDNIIVCQEDEDCTGGVFWINTTYNPVRADVGESNPSNYNFGPAGSVSAFDLIDFGSTPTSSGLYLGSVNMGYYNHTASEWRTYMDYNGNFYLRGSGSHALTWDGSTLAVTGTITVGSTALTESNTLNTNTTAANVGLSNVDNDSTATIQAGTTAANVGLGNVDNLDSQGQAQAGLITGTTITGGGITLSSGGAIKGGQTGYDSGTGFFLGYSSGYKFSIGNASGNKLTWNGSALAITGDISGGTIAGAAITAGTINVPASSPKFSVNANGILTAVDGNFSGSITTGDITITGLGSAGIDIGGTDATSWHMDAEGKQWWGNFANYETAAYRIANWGGAYLLYARIGGAEEDSTVPEDSKAWEINAGNITNVSTNNSIAATDGIAIGLNSVYGIFRAAGGKIIARGYPISEEVAALGDIRMGIAQTNADQPTWNLAGDIVMSKESGNIRFSVEQALLVDDGAVTINNGLTLGTLSGGASNKLYRSGSTLYWNGSAVGGVDWTADQGSTNIHSGNYTNTTYTSSDFNHDSLTGFVTNEHIDWSASQSANIHSNNYTNTTYTHPSLNHIPTGGSTDQFLKYSSSGTAVWAADNNDVYTGGNGISISSGNVITHADTSALTGLQSYSNRFVETLTVDAEGHLTAVSFGVAGGGGDHGALTGLADNDHPQYSLTSHDHSGTYYESGSTIRAASGTSASPGLSFSADTNLGWYRSAENVMTFSAGNSIRLHLSSDGMSNWPGTAALPSYSFLNDANTGMWQPTADTIAFSCGQYERMRIDSSGRLGVMKTNPSHTIHSGGTIYATGALFAAAASYHNGACMPWTTNADNLGHPNKFWDDFYHSGSTQTSDVSLKENIEDATYGLDFISTLRPVTYTKKTGGTGRNGPRTHHGFIAQEIETLLGDDADHIALWADGYYPAVSAEDDPFGVGQDEGHVQGLRYVEFIPILTKALQEISNKLDAAEARIAVLETA